VSLVVLALAGCANRSLAAPPSDDRDLSGNDFAPAGPDLAPFWLVLQARSGTVTITSIASGQTILIGSYDFVVSDAQGGNRTRITGAFTATQCL
jgi:hypothetical protein